MSRRSVRRRGPRARAAVLGLATLGLAAFGGAGVLRGEPAPSGPTWPEVHAIFDRACTHCHGGDRPVADLSLDTRALALKGGAAGAVIVPKDAAASRLVKHLRGVLEPRMPFDGDALPEADIQRVEAWIAAGAPDAAVPVPVPGAPAAPPVPPAPPGPPAGVSPPAPVAPPAEAPLRFGAVAPILKRSCVRCHQERGLRGPAPERLRLTDLASVLHGGDRLAVLPGRPEASPLTRALRGRTEKRMPLDGPPWLAEADILALERWIRDGARDDEGRPAAVPAGRRLRLVGRWEVGDRLDGVALTRDGGARIDDDVRVGANVEARLRVASDGSLVIERLRAR